MFPFTAALPVEVPWLKRVPGHSDVEEHVERFQVPGHHGALWMVAESPAPGTPPTVASIVELYLDGDTIRSVSHRDEKGRPLAVDLIDFGAAMWLPLTPWLWPVCLLEQAPLVDSTGAPIVHVETARALAAADHFEGTAANFISSYATSAEESQGDSEAVFTEVNALRAVVRERDHHAARVGELLHAGTWSQLRARAFASYLPSLACLVCAWAGSPHATALDGKGVLRCHVCSCAGLVDPRHPPPAFIAGALLDDLFIAVEWALRTDKHVTIEGTNQHGEAMREAVELPTRAAWERVAIVGEALGKLLAPGVDLELHVERGTLRAAALAGDSKRLRRLLDMPPEIEVGANMIALWAGTKGVPSSYVDGRWSCCTMPVCLCGKGWLLDKSANGDA